MSQSLSQALLDLSTQDIDENPWLYEEIAKHAAEARALEERVAQLEAEIQKNRTIVADAYAWAQDEGQALSPDYEQAQCDCLDALGRSGADGEGRE